MKRFLLSSLAIASVGFLLATRAFAGPETIVRKRAEDLRNQNNVRQGVPSPSQSARPGAPAWTQAQNATLVRLQTALEAVKAEPTAKQKLANELIAATLEAKPTPTSATKLADGLVAALISNPLSVASRTRLAQDLDAVLNTAKYPQAKIPGILEDIRAIFQESGLDRKRATSLADDVKALTSGSASR